MEFETNIKSIKLFETDVKSSSKRMIVQTLHPLPIFNLCGCRRCGGGPAERPPKAAEAAEAPAVAAAAKVVNFRNKFCNKFCYIWYFQIYYETPLIMQTLFPIQVLRKAVT